MKPSQRSEAIITEKDFREILKLAQEDIESFFNRNPRYKPYSGKECLITLGQGGALHYIDQKNGVKDFDVWFFYPAIDDIVLPYRRRGVIDFGESKFGRHPDDKGYKGRKIDVMMRSIPHFSQDNPEKSLQEYLSKGSTKTANMLARKAMLGLFPDLFFGKVLWNKG